MLKKFKANLIDFSKKDVFLAIIATLIWRIYLQIILIVEPVKSSWSAWDGNWYINVINNCYQFAEAQSNVAFFPLFPLIVKTLHYATRLPYLYVGLTINFFLTFFACWLICKLVCYYRKSASTNQKLLALAIFLTFPTSFYLAAFYAEALLIFLTTTSIYLLLVKKQWFGFVNAGLATTVKFTGIIVPVILTFIFVSKNRISFKNIAKAIGFLVVGLSGLLLFIVYLKIKVGDGLAFIKVQKYWGRTNDFFIISLLKEYFDLYHCFFVTGFSKMAALVRVANGLLPFVVLGLSYYLYKLKQYWISLFAVLVVLVPLSSGSFTSILRYVLLAVPVLAAYFASRLILNNRKRIVLFSIYIALSVATMSILCFYFLQHRAFIA